MTSRPPRVSNPTSTTKTYESSGNYETTNGITKPIKDYNSDPNRVLAENAATTRQAKREQIGFDRETGQNAIELSRQRDVDVDRSRERNLSADFSRSDQAARRDNSMKIEETALDRAKSSKEFSDNLFLTRAKMSQDRSNQEYSAQANKSLEKQAQDAAAFEGLAARAAQANMQANDLSSQERRSAETVKVALAGQGAQTEQARIAAKSQVTAAMFGNRTPYQGY